MADSPLFVADVYDLASEIGKEFEILIGCWGIDTIRTLMTKVIVTLEHLESNAVIVDNLQSELFEIKTRVQQLEYEKMEKAEFRKKLDQELEIIEENWRSETDYLNTLVVKLQEENKRLSVIISEKEKHAPNDCKVFVSDEELLELKKLKELAEQQRAQLMSKDKEVLDTSNELDKVQIDLEKLTKVYKDLTHRNKHLQKQIYTLVEEKSSLQANVQNLQTECQELQSKLNAVVKENIDLSIAEDRNPDFQGKILIHLDDPNRPRFTLDELRHILFERNDLKARVSELEDELLPHKQNYFPNSLSLTSLSVDHEEDPVQGPINKEPEEKLNPEKKKLGIRRFFDFLRHPL